MLNPQQNKKILKKLETCISIFDSYLFTPVKICPFMRSDRCASAAAALVCNMMENELSPCGETLVFEPFEIKTIKICYM